MERVEQYRQSIRQVLTSHATFESDNSDIESQLMFDTEHDHYQLLEVGWEGLKRVYNCIIHLDIKDGKIWIQRNMTDVDIAQEFVAIGVPKEDIILGLHREHLTFAKISASKLTIEISRSKLQHPRYVFQFPLCARNF